jgi:hypothetical protein
VPPNLYAKDIQCVLDFSNYSVDPNLKGQANGDKVKSATFALASSSDFESTATLAVIDEDWKNGGGGTLLADQDS